MSSVQAWKYLEQRKNSSSLQYVVKGTRIQASTLYYACLVNKMTPEEVAEDRGLPVAAVIEAIRYSKQNLKLIKREAAEIEALVRRSGLGG